MIDGSSSLRARASDFLRKHSWLPAIATVGSGLALIAALAFHAGLLLQAAACAVLLSASYLWGYADRASRQSLQPPLTHLARRQYGEVWDLLAPSAKEARDVTGGDGWAGDASDLLELASIGEQDEVLEIGCGIGRLGLVLAPHCRVWTGADISKNMLTHASGRLRGVSNVRLVRLRDVGLEEFRDSSFDVVYSISVFAHLDEMDRWRYVEEAARVLRSGGRLCIENIDIESDQGWTMFINHARRSQSLERPSYDTRFSTAAELLAYVTRAGFTQIQSHHRPPRAFVTAIKPNLDHQ